MNEAPLDIAETGGKTLLLLLVEDNEADAEICLRELRKAGLKIDADVVDTRDAFARQVRSKHYDLILSDYNLPGWTGMEALEILQQQELEIPLLLVTGALGEEMAVECIKKGVADYVLKDNLMRLPTTIERTLAERRLRIERKRARETEARLISIVEASTDSIGIAGSDGLLLYMNRAGRKVLGISEQEDLTGKALSDYYSPSEKTRFIHEIIPDCIRNGLWTGETITMNYDGFEIPVWQTAIAHRTPDGDTQFIAIISRDLTERKNLEEERYRARELELRREEAVRANESKSQFLSMVNHELRTPLNVILGFTELLSDRQFGMLNDRQQRYLSNIHTAGKHLLEMIKGILDLSKIDSGRVDLAIEEVMIARAVNEATTTLRVLADQKSQILRQDVQDDIAVLADPTRLRQMLMNLVGNAIKFTPNAGVIVIGAREEDGQVRVEVQDSGPGIPLEEQKRIFDPFHRLRQSDQQVEGTGLGLTITRRLAELQGGNLGLDSQPGLGSCFYFTLPSATRIALAPRQDAERTFRLADGLRVLVIEDDPRTAQLIKAQLVSAGYSVMLCDQAQRAAELAAELEPDAVTLDLLMKPVSGWDALHQMKLNPKTRKIPVIILTVLSQPGLGAAFVADEYLVKPVERADLLAAVERCLSLKGVEPSTRPILVVEDDPQVREVLADALRAQGYEVRTAVDGAQARDYVAASLPGMVVLDLLLPKVSGLELMSEWRTAARTADLPVFVLTGKDLGEEETKYLRCHAEGLFQKQSDWQEHLVRQLRRVAGQRQSVKNETSYLGSGR